MDVGVDDDFLVFFCVDENHKQILYCGYFFPVFFVHTMVLWVCCFALLIMSVARSSVW